MKKTIDFVLRIMLVGWFCFVIYYFVFYLATDEIQYHGMTFYLKFSFDFTLNLITGLLMFVISLLVLPPINFAFFYLLRHKLERKIIKTNSKFDKQNLEYYREILNKMCPGTISYLKKFKIDSEKDIAAHILKLLYQGYLVEENNTFKRTSKDAKKLSYADLEILRIIDGEYFSYKDYEMYIEYELLENGMIERQTKSGRIGEKRVVYKLAILSIVFTLLAILSPVLFAEAEFLSVLFIIGIFSLMFAVVVVFVIKESVFHNYNGMYTRTEKGKDMLKKIHELNKFLLAFGNFEQKNYKEVYTRDYYLIYAVVLGINKAIPEEIVSKVAINNNKKCLSTKKVDNI